MIPGDGQSLQVIDWFKQRLLSAYSIIRQYLIEANSFFQIMEGVNIARSRLISE